MDEPMTLFQNDKTLFRWRAETGFLVLRESYEFIFRYLFRYLFFSCLMNALKIGLLRVSHWAPYRNPRVFVDVRIFCIYLVVVFKILSIRSGANVDKATGFCG